MPLGRNRSSDWRAYAEHERERWAPGRWCLRAGTALDAGMALRLALGATHEDGSSTCRSWTSGEHALDLASPPIPARALAAGTIHSGLPLI
jgi:hypothetical protein